MVAGYVDKIVLEPWSQGDWNLFPNATKVEIVKKASSNFGHVLDVEPGDATPSQAPGWVNMRRRSGLLTPTIYCNLSTWPTVQKAFNDQGVAHPLYWIAQYNDVKNLPVLNGITAIAKQYHGNDPGNFDLSYVADYWPGVDPIPTEGDWLDMATKEEIQDAVFQGTLAALREVFYNIRYADGRNFADEAAQQTGSLLGIQGQLDGIAELLTPPTP